MTQTPTDRMGYGGPEDDEIEDKSAEHKKDLEDLFYDVSKDLREDPSCEKQPEFRQQCLDKITPYINKWAQRSTRSPVPNFVHRVFERDVFFTDESGNELGVYFGKPVREFLLGLAIPVNLEQLAETSPSPGRLTALHRAIDQSSRGFAPLLCRLIKQGIQDGKLSKAKASGIISQKNAKNENCLHLALKKDLEVSEDLIELADYATFVQQSDNGNTPLHDALEFPAPVEAKIWEHRYLVPAPICETLARQVSVQDFAEDVRPDRHAEDLTCCNRCLEFDKKYTNLKRRRSKIICALIKKCPDSLALHNKMGRSPFSYHVLAREEFKRNNPDFFVRANQRKQAYKQLNIKTEAFERLNRRRSVNMETTRGGGQQRIAAQPGRGQAKSPLPYNAGQEEIFANVGRILKSTHSFELEGLARTPTWQDSGKSGEVQDCSQELSPDWFHLSQEVEELLWETAFKVGSYREARRCLFPLAVTEGTKDEFGMPASLLNPKMRHVVERLLTRHSSVRG